MGQRAMWRLFRASSTGPLAVGKLRRDPDFLHMKRPLGMKLHQERQRDVINGRPTLGLAAKLAMVGVAVKDSAQGVAIQRLFQPAATEEGKNLAGLGFNGVLDRGVVEQGVAVLAAEAREGRFELEGLLQRRV